MANCTNCGAAIRDGVKFCTECGAAAPEGKPEPTPAVQKPKPQPQTTGQRPQTQQIPRQTQPQQIYQQPAYAQPAPVYVQPQQEQAPGPDSPYGLISTGGYIGIMLLLCIPVIGLLLAVVWACGGCRKLQKRNLCRAMLIMMVVSLIFSLIAGFAIRGLVNTVIDTVKDQVSESTGVAIKEDKEGSGLAGLLGGLIGEDTSLEKGSTEEVSGLLAGILGGDLAGLMDEVESINEEASEHSSGWPSDLPDYPDGTMDEVENYRTLITGSSAETMWSYIETLKQEGFKFQDFYDFGMSEADMKSMNAWWGTDGTWYLSISYADGTVTVDHTSELPDLSGLFGG